MSKSARDEGISDVRGHIERLETRARKLLSGAGDHRVVRNAASVVEASQNVLHESMPRGHAMPGGEATTELFLATAIGFDAQEQGRLLRHIAANRPSMSGQPQTVTETDRAVDLELFLSQRRAAALHEAVGAVHTSIEAQRTRRSEEAAERAAEQRYQSLCEALGMQAMQLLPLEGGHLSTSAREEPNSSDVRLMNEFAAAVIAAPAGRWATHIPNAAREIHGGRCESGEACLWATAAGMARILEEAGPAPTPAQTVAASRALLEEKFLADVFSEVLAADPASLDERSRTHPSVLKGVFRKYCRTSDPWEHVFVAVRAGCFETAALVADAENIDAGLSAALRRVANTPLTERNSPSCKADVSALLADPSSQRNVHRCAVLLILSGTNTQFHSMDLVRGIAERTATSLNDILWFRLSIVRGDVPAAPNGGSPQSLEDLQRSVVEDGESLLQTCGRDPTAYATVLLHALLPASAARVLLGTAQHIDGLHLALTFRAMGLRCTSDVEMPIELPRLVRRYATALMDCPAAPEDHPARAVFHYFEGSGCLRAFTELCQTPSIVLRLFGSGTASPSNGFLMRGPLSPSLLRALDAVLVRAVHENNLELAVRLVGIVSAAAGAHGKNVDDETSRARAMALATATRALSRHLAHALHGTGASPQLAALADQLFESLYQTGDDIPVADINDFRVLRALLYIHAAPDAETAVQYMRRCEYIPADPSSVDAAQRKLRDMLSSDIVWGVLPTVALTMLRAVQHLYHSAGSGEARTALRVQAQAVVQWTQQWPQPVPSDINEQLHAALRSVLTS